MAGQIVRVSLLQPQGFKTSEDAEVILYPMGIVEMPIEHARAMGLLDRIQGTVESTQGTPQAMANLPFNGAFDEKLTSILERANYNTIEDLSKASQDQLMALGIGPADYERIYRAAKGG